MIINLLINLLVLVIGAIFSWLPPVTVLPTVFGFDVDSALVTAVGQFNVFSQTFWPLTYLMQGFLVIMGYYAIKMGITFFFGHRTPGTK